MRLACRFTFSLVLFIALSIAFTPTYAANATVTDCTNFTGAGTISQAVTDANGGGGIITFACSGTIIFANALTITADVTINSNGNTVIFDGGNSTRHFTVNLGALLTLNGFTLENGIETTGGAILNSGNLTISNSTFTNNWASGGGAIRNTGTVTISNSIFTDNSAGDDGGAIENSFATLTIANSTFTNNSAVDFAGAVMNNNGTLTISNSTFTDNSATSANDAIYTNSTASSQDSHYQNNTCGGTITDNGGNTNTSSTGCPGTAPMALDVTPLSCVGNLVYFTINAGDANFDITGTGGVLPINDVPIGGVVLFGPATWTNIRVTERRGERQSVPLGDITCPGTIPLSASATCIGADLQVNILTGDTPFDIVDDSSTLRDDVVAGGYLITGPISTTNLRVVEQGGDGETFPLTDQNCFTSETLTASAVCNGANLDVTVSNGNAPFTIDVNGSIATGQPLGVYNFMGPNTFAVIVREETGDGETFTTSVTCTTTTPPSVPVPPAPILPPDPNALGCELTNNVDLANAPDNTYCRILMKNGGVVSYSGAIPADLIGLGVILAVDVYRLEGGQTLNTFPDYARICLSGTGRYFYMDGRNAPRVSVEMPTETIDGLTCAWIPAPGTVILTN